MYLVYDVTPTEKPKNYKAPFSEVNSWPRMMHVSWILLGQDMKPIEDFDCVVIPEGYNATKKIDNYGKLDDGERDRKATSLDDVLKQFAQTVEKAKYLISHNANMNACVLAAEYMRKGEHPNLFTLEHICLMQEATWYCKIPNNRGGYKWPSLTELYAILFKQRYTPAGNARADVIAATRSFLMLHKIGELEDVFDKDEDE